MGKGRISHGGSPEGGWMLRVNNGVATVIRGTGSTYRTARTKIGGKERSDFTDRFFFPMRPPDEPKHCAQSKHSEGENRKNGLTGLRQPQ